MNKNSKLSQIRKFTGTDMSNPVKIEMLIRKGYEPVYQTGTQFHL